MLDSILSRPATNIATPAANMVTTSHSLLADPRLKAGVAVVIPCIVLALTWRHFRSNDGAQAKPRLPAKTQKPKAKDPVRQHPPPSHPPPPPSDAEKPKRKAPVREQPPAPSVAPNPAPLLPPFSPETPIKDEADFERKDSTPVFDQPAYFEQDSVSVHSGSSAEQHKHRKLRVGKNLKRAWSKRPFANGGGAGAEQHAQSPISPLSAGQRADEDSNVRMAV